MVCLSACLLSVYLSDGMLWGAVHLNSLLLSWWLSARDINCPVVNCDCRAQILNPLWWGQSLDTAFLFFPFLSERIKIYYIWTAVLVRRPLCLSLLDLGVCVCVCSSHSLTSCLQMGDVSYRPGFCCIIQGAGKSAEIENSETIYGRHVERWAIFHLSPMECLFEQDSIPGAIKYWAAST